MRDAISRDPGKAVNLLKLSLELSEVMVLNGLLKLSVLETRMKMEPGGVERQGLRLGKDGKLHVYIGIHEILGCVDVITVVICF